jgi:hypothetical protein
VLTIASLLSILFMTFHLTDDIIRGMEKGGVSHLVAVPIFVVWLYGTLVVYSRWRRRAHGLPLQVGLILAVGVDSTAL